VTGVSVAPQLETPRLTLRQSHDCDAEPFAAMNADPEVMRHFPAPLDRAGSDALLARDTAGDFDHPNLPLDSGLRRHVLYRLKREEWTA